MRAPAAAAPSDVTTTMRAASCRRVPASIPVAFLRGARRHRCGERRRTSGGGTHHSGVGDVARASTSTSVDRASVCAVARVPMDIQKGTEFVWVNSEIIETCVFGLQLEF